MTLCENRIYNCLLTKTLRFDTVEDGLKHLKQEIDKMLSEAEAKDAEEDKTYGADKRGDEIPDDLRDRKSRINRLKVCKARLEQEKAVGCFYYSLVSHFNIMI